MTASNRVAFSILGFPIYWYGLLIALGLLGGVVCAALREKRLGVKRDTTLDFLLLALPVALVCARAYYVAFSWSSYAAHPLSVFNLREGGLAIYGGVIGGVLSALIFSRRRKISFGTLADLCAPSLALGQAVGRWGNFFNQEAYGAVLSDPALHFFPVAVLIEADGMWHAATFFYESAWCLIVAVVLLSAERRGAFARRGDLFAAYLFLYAAERIVVEGLRTDSLMLGPIRVSQLLSAALMLGVMLWLLLRRPSRRPLAFFCAGAAALGLLLGAIWLGSFAAQVLLAAWAVAMAAALYAGVSAPEPAGK